MRWVLVVALLLTLAAPARSSVLTSDDQVTFQRWVDGSLIPTPAHRIRLRVSGCVTVTGPRSCATPGLILMAPQDADNRPIFLHELGHQADYFMLRSRDRYRFRRILGIPDSVKWRPGVQEIWATAWSLCARYRVLPAEFETQYDYRPLPSVHDATCRFMRGLKTRR